MIYSTLEEMQRAEHVQGQNVAELLEAAQVKMFPTCTFQQPCSLAHTAKQKGIKIHQLKKAAY